MEDATQNDVAGDNDSGQPKVMRPNDNKEEDMWKRFYEKTQEDAAVAAASSAAAVANSDSKSVQALDDGFFEKYGSQLKETVETKEAIIDEENREREKYLEEDSTEDDATCTASLSDLTDMPEPTCSAEDLFCDVYYQCTHLVGQDASASLKKDTIVSYLKELFDFDDAKCKILIENTKNRQPPKLMLKVEVVEAKDLAPKDANGLSDPFCALWISSSQTNRFTTNVKDKTLAPVWRENFQLPVSSASNDVLHFEVWDFDPAETVKEKMSKIGNVKGLRGVRKLAKEVLQAMSSGKHDDELIGLAQITLKNIPATGQMAWFKLTKRNKKTESGTILLKMLFGSEKDERVALEEHRYLVKLLLQRRMKMPEFDLSTWDGSFDVEGELILRQHLAQSNLGFTDDGVAKFAEYVNAHQTKPLNYAVLAQVVRNLTSALKNNFLTEDEITLFWNNVRKLLPSCFNSIRKIRKSAPADKKIIIQLDGVLSIIEALTTCNVPDDVDLFPSHLYGWVATTDKFTIKSILHEAVLHGAYDWFEYLANRNKPENHSDEAILKHFVKITQLISLDLEGAKEHHEIIFKERLNFPYAKTLFAVYQSSIVEMVGSVVTDMCMMMKPLDFEKRNDKEANNDPLAAGTTMFELFLILQSIDKLGAELFRNDDAFETFALRKFYNWFFSGVVKWLDIAAYKALQRIDKAVELDDFVPVDSSVQYSSSAVDTMAIFHQVKTFWNQLAWPDIEGSYTFMAKIIDDICKSSVHYADRVAAKVDGLGDMRTADGKAKFKVTIEWCVAINNIDYIHFSIHPFVRQLGLDDVVSRLADFKDTVSAEHCRQTLELVMANAVDNVGNKIAELLETLATKMEPAMIRFLQEGAELLHQQNDIIDNLMRYLDENLATLHSKLNPDNFNRVLEVIWEKLACILSQVVQNGMEKRKPSSFFANLSQTLQILIGFFKLGESGISEEENTKLDSKIADIKTILTIYGMDTTTLIHEYHLERLREQNEINKSEDGQMAISLQFDKGNLHVEILNAQNIRPMDSNGYSDPFVSLRLLPKEKFPGTKHKTKVQKKTLTAFFDEKFTIPLTPEQRAIENGLVMFVMKDQDFYGAKNDYMAEAFVRIGDASDIDSAPYPKQIHLQLNRPSDTESKLLKALDYRQGDKQARDFVKKQKARMEVPH